jgi:hypothetical protein
MAKRFSTAGKKVTRGQRDIKTEVSDAALGPDEITFTSSEQTSNSYSRIVSIQLSQIGKYVFYGGQDIQGFIFALVFDHQVSR